MSARIAASAWRRPFFIGYGPARYTNHGMLARPGSFFLPLPPPRFPRIHQTFLFALPTSSTRLPRKIIDQCEIVWPLRRLLLLPRCAMGSSSFVLVVAGPRATGFVNLIPTRHPSPDLHAGLR